MPTKKIKVLFITGFGPIVRNQGSSRKLYLGDLGLSFKEEEGGYLHTEDVEGAKTFGLWPLSQAAQSCFGSDAFCALLKRLPGQRNTLLLCGMESHICVTQTALGALREGYLVHVASDAVSSRTECNWKIGLDRMRAAGAIISSTEMMIYELMRSSSSEAFKELLPHLKG